jgi:hypothetical protein
MYECISGGTEVINWQNKKVGTFYIARYFYFFLAFIAET